MPIPLSALSGEPLASAVLNLCGREPRDVVLSTVESSAKQGHIEPDLAFVVAALRLAFAPTNAPAEPSPLSGRTADDDRAAAALPWVERVLEAFPKFAAAQLLAARCHLARRDGEEALKAYRRASVFAARKEHDAREAALAGLLRWLDGDDERAPHAPLDVWRELLRQGDRSSEAAGPNSFRARAVSDLLAKTALPPDLRRRAREVRANEYLVAGADELALRDLDALFTGAGEEGQQPSLALSVGFVRALLRLDRATEAYDRIRQTVAEDAEASAAFLRSLDLSAELGTDEFTRATAGLKETPTRAEVERAISRCHSLHLQLSALPPLLARAAASLGDEAKVAGNLALAGALARDEDDLLARALQHFGLTLVFANGAKRGLALLLRARQVAQKGSAQTPLALADVVHALGVGHLWEHGCRASADHLEAAEQAFDEALALRTDAGADDAAMGQSRGDLARLAVARGDERGAEAHRKAAIAHLLRATQRPPLAISGAEHDAWCDRRLDALVNLTLVALQHATAALRQGLGAQETLDRVEAAMAHAEATRREGVPLPGGPDEQLLLLLEGCRGAAFRGHAKRVAGLRAALLARVRVAC